MSRSTWPPTAMLMLPVSSETMTETASVSSVMPIPARWRVPSWVESSGFMESGRKQAAAATRSFCTMTAPSCSGRAGTEESGQQVVGEMGVESDAALDVGAQSDLALDDDSAPVWSWEKVVAAMTMSS